MQRRGSQELQGPRREQAYTRVNKFSQFFVSKLGGVGLYSGRLILKYIRTDKVRLRRSSNVKTKRGRHRKKAPDQTATPTAVGPPLGEYNAVDKPLMLHGRIKVKTTLEQQEAKRKERERKLQLYVSATQAAFNKPIAGFNGAAYEILTRPRRNRSKFLMVGTYPDSQLRKGGQLDKEALEITAQILALNPDFASLWNLRREVFLALGSDRSDEEMRSLYLSELSFLQNCLRVNPKSYGTWYHRCWIMKHMPEPDWARELTLCNQFLEIDERNFHCWGYRRFVAQSFHVPPSDELEYTSDLITKNFSNYSSWHYRSKLLPQIHPDPQHLGRATEKVLLSELELVQNAFFTDPNDQSAWFYHRWLLGRADLPLSIRCISVDVAGSWISITFSQPVLVGVQK
ncbi:unnamed protein product [Ranitomeya imitator]|uniref:Geranylgeranyl transferase type-2 subunit alpha n=1 Tax=Ranitomeya imitator TaxID=111125 RepID=A0ABN9MEI8_9NEOB|nr:unnamed protein product [Ranitomeya imitator]